MALKYKLKSPQEAPPELAAHYVERDGVWILDAEGAADETEINTTRQRCEALTRERDELARRFEGIDPELARQSAAQAAELQRRLDRIQIEHSVVAAGTRRGLHPTAGPDLAARAHGAMALVNGVPVVLDADGKTPRKAKTGDAPMGVEEWLDQQISQAPHLFDGNAGGGAVGTPPGSTRPQTEEVNPFSKETFNLTKAMEVLKQDPQKAARLKAEAGVR